MNVDPPPDEAVRDLFRKHVPEVADGTVAIVAVARRVGRRSCLVVRSHDASVCAVGACTGVRGARAKAMAAELGEHFTVVEWQPSQEQFITTAFSCYSRDGVILDSARRAAVVTLDRFGGTRPRLGDLEDLAALVAELTGWDVRVEGIESEGG